LGVNQTAFVLKNRGKSELLMSCEDKKRNHVLWIIGPTASGKTTLAEHILLKMREKGILAIHYDGDEVRDFFDNSLGFGVSDRLKVVKTLIHLSNKALFAGFNVIVSALTAHEDARTYVKHNVANLVFIYLECSIERCIERDPKGLYKKAINREIDTLIGFNDEYIPPENPDIIINTEGTSAEMSVLELMKRLGERGIIL